MKKIDLQFLAYLAQEDAATRDERIKEGDLEAGIQQVIQQGVLKKI